jgi:hypothetical protein
VLGSFKDPLGRANIFDLEKLSEEARNLLENKTKFNAEFLSVKNYVVEFLPNIFAEENNDIEAEKYRNLLIGLSNHLPVFDDESVVKIFEKVKFVPTSDGSFREAKNVVFPVTNIVQVLDAEFTNWLDMRFVPESKRVKELLERLGVLTLPSPSQIVQVWRSVTEQRITPEGQNQVIGILEIILEHRDKWVNEELKSALKSMKDKHVLPVKGDNSSWHIPSLLYSPEYATTFSTQTSALVVDVDPGKRDLLKFLCDDLGLKPEPEAKLVVRHLIRCQEAKLKVDVKAYAFLNRIVKRNLDRDLREILENLRDTPIYHFGEDKFMKPCDLYFENPKIPSPWAYQVGKELLQYEDLLKLTGVKTRPSGEDYLRILREISVLDSLNVNGKDIAEVYIQCWKNLNLDFQQDQISPDIIQSLSSEALIQTKSNKFKSIDEVLIQDSDWFSERFQENFDDYLVKFDSSFIKILEGLGVGHVSKNIISNTGEILGEVTSNFHAQKLFHDRRESIGAILFGLDPNFNKGEIWKALQVYSVEEVKSHWKLMTGVGPSKTFILNLSVFLNIAKSELYITRDQFEDENSFSWTPIIRDMLHQLLPAIPENNIRNAISTFDAVLSRSPEGAREYLLEIGFKFSDDELLQEPDSVTSEILSTLGDGSIDSSEHDSDVSGTSDNSDSFVNRSEKQPVREPSNDESVEEVEHQEQPGQALEEPLESVTRNSSGSQRDQNSGTSRRLENSSQNSSHEGTARNYPENGKEPEARFSDNSQKFRNSDESVYSSGVYPNNQIREPQKQREISNAYIYVSNAEEAIGNSERRERALKNENKSRDFVIKYETSEGRIAEAMSQTNAGYDIESIENDDTGDLRFIEVKSLSGYWGAEGISLSIKQLEWAYKKGKAYWIYIVENVSNENIRLYKVQDPAKHIRAYKFNHAWKQIAEGQESKLTSQGFHDDFIGEEDVGFDIWHSVLGKCFLYEWNLIGEVVKVKLLFEGDDQPREFPFNPRTMKKIND